METDKQNPRHASGLVAQVGENNALAACEGLNPRVLYGDQIGCNPVPATSYCPSHHPTAYASRVARHKAVAK